MDLRLSDVTHNSARITWNSNSNAVNGYRIMYVKADGVQTNEVRHRSSGRKQEVARTSLPFMNSSHILVNRMKSERCRLCEQVDVGHVTSWLLRNLTSLTEYTVGVFALYDEGRAEAVSDSFITSTTLSLLSRMPFR